MSEKKILIVDDDEAVITLLSQVFSRAGYTVHSALSSEDALRLLENEEDINVMFFDLNMPEINGIELCQQVKKNIPISLIYAITGYASLFQLAECRAAGFEDYFKKPVNIKILVKTAEDSFEKLERWRSS